MIAAFAADAKPGRFLGIMLFKCVPQLEKNYNRKEFRHYQDKFSTTATNAANKQTRPRDVDNDRSP